MITRAAKINLFLPLDTAELPVNPPELPVMISNDAGSRGVASHSIRSTGQKGMN